MVWAAGEAAAVQRIRRYLFDERRDARDRTTVRGYWKHGRGGDTHRRLNRALRVRSSRRITFGVEPALARVQNEDGATGEAR